MLNNRAGLASIIATAFMMSQIMLFKIRLDALEDIYGFNNEWLHIYRPISDTHFPRITVNTKIPIPHPLYALSPSLTDTLGCHNDWWSTLQPEGMMSSHPCLFVLFFSRFVALLASARVSEACQMAFLNQPPSLSVRPPPPFVNVKTCVLSSNSLILLVWDSPCCI